MVNHCNEISLSYVYHTCYDDFVLAATPVSGRSSRASIDGARPPSRADSEASEKSEPDIYTTVQKETKSIGGRNQTTLTYQTHVVKTHTASTPTHSTHTPGKVSKIPKPSPRGK